MTEEVHTIRIPRSLNSLRARLTDLESVAMATGWERSVNVYAWTFEGKGGNPNLTRSREVDPEDVGRYTISEFAKLGIPGLTTQDAVRAYRVAWKQAMADDGARDARPGQEVALPERKFPPVVSEEDHRYKSIEDRDAIKAQAQEDGTSASKALDIAKNKPAMEAAITASPAVAAAARHALGRRNGPPPPPTRKEAQEAVKQAAKHHPDVVTEAATSTPEAAMRTRRALPPEQPSVPQTQFEPVKLGEADAGHAAYHDSRICSALHNAITNYGERVKDAEGDPGRLAHLADRGGPLYQRLGAFLDAARGLSDADLAALLVAGGDER